MFNTDSQRNRPQRKCTATASSRHDTTHHKKERARRAFAHIQVGESFGVELDKELKKKVGLASDTTESVMERVSNAAMKEFDVVAARQELESSRGSEKRTWSGPRSADVIDGAFTLPAASGVTARGLDPAAPNDEAATGAGALVPRNNRANPLTAGG